MKSKKADSTKTRQPSTGKKQVPGKARTVTDTDDWLSIDDLEPVVWTAEELAAPHVLRTPDGLTVATYPPNVEQLRKRPSRLEEDGFSCGFVAIPPAQKLSNGKCSSCGRLQCRELPGCRGASPAEFIASYEAGADRMRKAVRDGGWINPDAKEQPPCVNDSNRLLVARFIQIEG